MKWIRAAILLLLAAGTAFVLGTRFGLIPPLGKFLDPATGFWQNGRGVDELPTVLALTELQDTVHVVWDDRQIPHIFASNKHDLYFAQGYLTARARLWQMDFVPRAAAGRLSEIIGPSMLTYDKHQRRIGMLWGAEKDTAAMQADSVSGPAIRAYAAGVNSYRTSLEPEDLPVEFKMLDYEPEEFTVLSVALVLKSFQQTLTFRNSDLALSYSWRAMDSSMFHMLYPSISPFPEPVIPSGTNWDFDPMPLPGPPPPLPYRPAKSVGESGYTQRDQLRAGPPVIGSNNWVVSGSRSITGRPFLANDMHLGLSLPGVWYECHM
jgi:penicillin amidase